MITIGRIVRPQGNRGEVVIALVHGFRRRAVSSPGRRYWPPGTASVETMTVTSSREHDGRWVVGFAGVTTINEAEALRGLELRIPADQLRPCEAGHVLRARPGWMPGDDAVRRGSRHRPGCPVGYGRPAADGGRGPDGEVLIPFSAEFCRRVDVAAKAIVIDPPEGLLELNRGGAK